MKKENKIAIVKLGDANLPLALAYNKYNPFLGLGVDTECVELLHYKQNKAGATHASSFVIFRTADSLRDLVKPARKRNTPINFNIYNNRVFQQYSGKSFDINCALKPKKVDCRL